MTVLVISAFTVLFVLIIIILVKLYSEKTADISPQILDFKNELNELRIKQMESQKDSLAQQHQLFVESQKQIDSHLNQMMTHIGQNLSATQSNITNQLASSNRVFSDINTKLGALETTAKNIQEIGKDISSLQSILQAPKLRGNLGEFFLEDLLTQILPNANFEIKHSFKNGTQVDAIIKLGGNIVSVDSKFPLESFQRLIAANSEDDKKIYKREFINTVKKRIDEISGKYINPAEGTFDFAIMYIPAENVYYETIINDSLTNKDYELFNYAMSKHVIPVSPNSFYAYLQALAYGLKGLQIEQEAKNMLGKLSKIQDKFGKFFEDYNLVGKHLSNAMGKYQDSEKKAEKLNGEVNSLTGQKTELIGE